MKHAYKGIPTWLRLCCVIYCRCCFAVCDERHFDGRPQRRTRGFERFVHNAPYYEPTAPLWTGTVGQTDSHTNRQRRNCSSKVGDWWAIGHTKTLRIDAFTVLAVHLTSAAGRHNIFVSENEKKRKVFTERKLQCSHADSFFHSQTCRLALSSIKSISLKGIS